MSPHEQVARGLNGLSAAEASRLLEKGDISSERLVRDCLDRIEAREKDVMAWDFIDPDHALAQARTLDRQPRRGPLHGVPIAIKDIFDTFDMPTGHGFPPYAGLCCGVDTYCVSVLRDAGMVIMGKTTTTEFACPLPRQTRNPRDLSRSPGVSSSGSAAVVADLMAPVALGSQTGGSVIVPAAFTGVYGYKSSPGAMDRAGYRHCKPSLDTIGFFARTFEDLLLLRRLYPRQAGEGARAKPPRIGFVTATKWSDADAPMRRAMQAAREAMARGGADTSDLRLPDELVDIDADFVVVNGWESAQALKIEIRDHVEAFNAFNRRKADAIRAITREAYVAALERVRRRRMELQRLMTPFDALVLPSAPGEALPFGPDPLPDDFAKFWSLMQLPAANLPVFDGGGLSLGLQVIGAKGCDDALLGDAQWIDAHLARDRSLRATLL